MILWFAPGSVPLSRNQGTLESVTEDLFDRSLVGRIDAHAIEECLDLGVELDKIKRQGFLVAKLRDVATKFPPLVQKTNDLVLFHSVASTPGYDFDRVRLSREASAAEIPFLLGLNASHLSVWLAHREVQATHARGLEFPHHLIWLQSYLLTDE